MAPKSSGLKIKKTSLFQQGVNKSATLFFGQKKTLYFFLSSRGPQKKSAFAKFRKTAQKELGRGNRQRLSPHPL